MATGDFIGKNSACFDPCLFKRLDLAIEGLLARGYLPFPKSGGILLFYLISQLYEKGNQKGEYV